MLNSLHALLDGGQPKSPWCPFIFQRCCGTFIQCSWRKCIFHPSIPLLAQIMSLCCSVGGKHKSDFKTKTFVHGNTISKNAESLLMWTFFFGKCFDFDTLLFLFLPLFLFTDPSLVQKMNRCSPYIAHKAGSLALILRHSNSTSASGWRHRP